MAFQRVLMVLFVVGGLGEATPWEDWLVDDPGLLQVNQQMLNQNMAAPNRDMVSLHSLDAMETLVTKISVGDPSDAEIDLVTSLIKTLEDEFKPELTNDSDEDKQAYATKIASHNTCKTHRDKRLNTDGDVSTLFDEFTSKRTKHAACRKATRSYSVFDTDVDLVAAGTWSTLAGVTGVTQVGALDTLCTSRSTFVEDVDAYNNLTPAGVSETCDTDQTWFEEEFCSWLSAKTSTCLACDACVLQVDAATFRSNIIQRDENRRATYQTIMKLQCRLQHLANTFNSDDSSDVDTTDTCSTEPLPGPTHYGFDNLVTPISIPSCLSDADIKDQLTPSLVNSNQCTQWRAQKYSWTSSERTIVESCQATCVVPTVVEDKTSTSGCVDQNTDECTFYSLHSDACGRYGAQAETMCCACSGGITTTPPPPPPAAPPCPAGYAPEAGSLSDWVMAGEELYGTQTWNTGGWRVGPKRAQTFSDCGALCDGTLEMECRAFAFSLQRAALGQTESCKLYNVAHPESSNQRADYQFCTRVSATTTFEIPPSSDQWTMVLQYGMEGITASADAIGTPSEDNLDINGNSESAKMADDDINSLEGDGDVDFDYFMITSDLQPVDPAKWGQNDDTGFLMVRIPANSFHTTEDGMGWAKSYALGYPQMATDLSEVTRWAMRAESNSDAFATNNVYVWSHAACMSWTMDSRGCPRSLSGNGDRDPVKKCFTGGGGNCGIDVRSATLGVRINVKIYKRTALVDKSGWLCDLPPGFEVAPSRPPNVRRRRSSP